MDGHLGLRTAIGVRGRLGSLYLVVGIGRRVVAVVCGIVVWWLWWLSQRNYPPVSHFLKRELLQIRPMVGDI